MSYNPIANRISQIILSGVTSNTTATIPAGWAITNGIYVRNTTANAITGGVRIGTTDGGIDVVVALAVGASAFVISVPLITVFSAGSTQTLFIQTVTAWNSASVDIAIPIMKVIP